VRQVLSGFGKGLRTHAPNQFGLVAKHGEETIQFGLNAGPIAAGEPADQCDEIERPPTAEMPSIGDMAYPQFGGMEVCDELAQYGVNPSSYREILRMSMDEILLP